MNRHIHLDVVGGISGDMFLSAMLSAFPEARAQILENLGVSGISECATLQINNVCKGGFAALQAKFDIVGNAKPTSHWADIRNLLSQSNLDTSVKERAIAIFQGLADAEASVHGVQPDQVHFHEVADWDSLADIVSAATLIEFVSANSWSVSALPLGRGLVDTAHGKIPVPAPATAELLRGFDFFDDGGTGERITPTGAAILHYVEPAGLSPQGTAKLVSIGVGAGQRDIRGIPNILRVLTFESAQMAIDLVSRVSFELDDMTPEEICVALDHIRDDERVLDAGYVMGFGKKGRARFEVSILADPAGVEAVAELCFEETSTIGLRVEPISRRVLYRTQKKHNQLGVKIVNRPNSPTAKVESDDLAQYKTLRARRQLARKAEETND